MSRFLFLLLLVANVALGAHLYLTHTQPKTPLTEEINANQLKIVGATDAASAQQAATTARRIVASLVGAECVEFVVKTADAARAQIGVAALVTSDRVSTRTVEEFTRYAISTTAQRDRKAVETLLANLKKADVKDVSIMAENTISLGVFSSEDAARRGLAELENKVGALIKGAVITPKNPQAKETIFTVRAADAALLARLPMLQAELSESVLRPAPCGASTVAAADSAKR